VCDFIEQNMVYGPGDLRGLPVRLDDEKVALIYRMYEVFPRGHRLQGRRRFKRGALSLAKGKGKTELSAWVAACELHPDAPVRCTGFSDAGDPIGGPVTDPYIPMVAYNEAQSSELAYEALRVVLEEGPLKDDFDIGLERIVRKKGDGKAVSLSSSPSARDGARTTFAVADETHWWTSARLKQSHQTMLANLAKRKIADPWMLEITTAPEPGAGSVAEQAMEYAQLVMDGRVADAALFFFHLQAGDAHDLTTIEGARAAVIEASGAAASWRDIDAIVNLWLDPTTDRAYWERVWCNRLVRSSTQAFSVPRWSELARPDHPIAPGRLITLGFDGAKFHDSTGLVATDVETGYQWLIDGWECPPGATKWQVPALEVDRRVRETFEQYRVWRLYADPPYWQEWVAKWSGDLDGDCPVSEKRVIEWWTNRNKPMAAALENFHTAITEGTIGHSGDPRLARHLGNARKLELLQRDDDGRRLWLIRKERPDSPHKIDFAMAAVLSWEARTDAIAAGAMKAKQFQMVILGGRS
jgi:phage terminase large subunit-like protein